MRPLAVQDGDKSNKCQPVPISGLRIGGKKQKHKIVQPLARTDLFHQGGLKNLMKANKVTSAWDENRHLLFSATG